jgi:glycosyltransferase involved in cell wall biosynthesis
MQNNFPQKPSICFVAHNAYGALSGTNTGHIGGIERQQALMAHWLAEHGYDTSMITWDEGPGDCVVDGIKVYTLGRREKGLPGLRFFHPRWTGLINAMKRANADIYHYHCGDLALGQVSLWTNLHGKKTIYSVASDPDCDPQLPSLSPWRERILYKYGLQHTDIVIAQTLRQQEMLRDGFDVRAQVIPMPCTGLAKNNRNFDSGKDIPHILWVGRFSQEKRLEWLLDVAEALPQYIFDVVGSSNTRSEYARDLQQRAGSISNVALHGRVPDHDLNTLYHRARLLCCTSVFEGFPNTFLEAWSVGLPVISTFDPDKIIARKKLGQPACSVVEICAGITVFIEDSRRWQEASSAAQSYFNTHHTLDAVMPNFVRLFQQIKK